MSDELKYFQNKKTDKVYVSPRLSQKSLDETVRFIRIVDKIIDSPELWSHAKLGKELVIRTTPKGRQQIIAKIYEDNKGIFVLTIQRFNTDNGNPHQVSFSFIGDEIKKFREFLESIPLIDFENAHKQKVTDDELKRVKEFLKTNPDIELIEETLKNFTKSDIVALGYRKKQLVLFDKLLHESGYFESIVDRYPKATPEAIWQKFFEKNPWIFGYGLNYVFNSPLEGKKLEQVIQGANIAERGKRADGILKTRGLINSLCLVEIKTHKTDLLYGTEYRPAVWQPSKELTGGVAQAQKNIQKTLETIGQRLETNNRDGSPTGETVYTFQPKSYLIIGCLDQFIAEHGVNTEKFCSFDLYRKNLNNIEIITFDELFERAKFIVQSNELEQQ